MGPSGPARRFSVLWILAALVGSLTMPASAQFNSVVLQVNDEIATLYDFKARLGAAEADLRRQADGDPEQLRNGLPRLPASVMKAMYHEMLMLSRAEQLGERVSPLDIDREIDRRRELLQIATEEEFRERLARSGLTMETLRDNISEEIAIQLVMQREVFARIDLEEDDLRKVWRDNPADFLIPEQRKLREVVVLSSSGLSSDEMMSIGEQVRSRFTPDAEAATVLGDLEERKVTSGMIDLDWVPKGDLDPALEEAIAGLEPGQASAPTVGRGGLHVIQLLDRQEESVLPFDEVKNRIYASERNRLYEKELPRYLKELEEMSYVVANPPPGAESFRNTDIDLDSDDPLAGFRSGTAPANAPAESPPEGASGEGSQ